uniref:Uncharacterized protein n=1 Tax=Siphoviridae sp. ctfYP22 TaxID=2827584 RepID=A0A8S5LIK7_9CAUD|nr:MAG TPA: hypothetical protein [Siphoviridae sp. ctfYP22]
MQYYSVLQNNSPKKADVDLVSQPNWFTFVV